MEHIDLCKFIPVDYNWRIVLNKLLQFFIQKPIFFKDIVQLNSGLWCLLDVTGVAIPWCYASELCLQLIAVISAMCGNYRLHLT